MKTKEQYSIPKVIREQHRPNNSRKKEPFPCGLKQEK